MMLDLVEVFSVMDKEDREREGLRHGIHYDAFVAAIEGHAEYEIVDNDSTGVSGWYNYEYEIFLCEGNYYKVIIESENDGNRVLVEGVTKVIPEEYTAIRWNSA